MQYSLRVPPRRSVNADHSVRIERLKLSTTHFKSLNGSVEATLVAGPVHTAARHMGEVLSSNRKARVDVVGGLSTASIRKPLTVPNNIGDRAALWFVIHRGRVSGPMT